MKRLSLALIIAVALFSCAQQAVQKEAPPAPAGQPAAQELVLPDVPIEPPKKEEKKPEVQKPPVTVEKAGEEKYVILNFDDADIDTVISTMGDLLQINYILAPGISGKVTIQSYKKFPVKDLFSIFQSILEMNGLTAVQNKDFYTIMPIDAAKQQPLDVEKGREVKMKLDSSFITQIVPLEFVKASDAVNLLRGLMPRGTDLIVYEPTNLLIVTARPEGIVKFMKIMEAIDIAPTERENIKTFVYYCESGEAKKLVEILKDLYAPKGAAKKPTGPTPQPRPPVSPPGTTPPSQPASSTVVGGTAGELEGDITITAYEDINAIIIKSSPGAYLALVETIKKLDIAPKQVLIEVLIVELTLNDTESLGIEWILKASGDPTALGGYTQKNVTVSLDDTKSGFLQPALTGITSGYFAAIIDPGKFIGIISAFATYGKANVLSSPHILALDNKEAKIEVGDEIPIATGVNTQNVGGTVQTSLVSTGQIQYKTIG
ncbi:MAG: secretin N-terminal domain-containing protein, partial [bacterium]